jgi:short chain dehydrogenase
MATYDELSETAVLVEKLDRRAVFHVADVRDRHALQAVVDAGLATFGHVDVVSANAGIWRPNWFLDIDDDEYQAVMDINVGGVCNTCKVVVPSMIEAGNGGSIVITSSAAGLRGQAPWSHYGLEARRGGTDAGAWMRTVPFTAVAGTPGVGARPGRPFCARAARWRSCSSIWRLARRSTTTSSCGNVPVAAR